MTRSSLLAFMRAHRMAVQASVSPDMKPQAAVVGVAVTDDFEFIFDTVDSSRKAGNLRRNAAISFVVGGVAAGEETTVQYEGIVDEPRGAELEALKTLYLQCFPDGVERQKWPGLVYLRARPLWLRYSDFHADPPEILEWNAAQLAKLP